MNLEAYLLVAALLFSIGVFGALTRRNAIGILMSLELMLNAANLNLVAFSRFVEHGVVGQVFVLFVITVAAAEAAVGLAIVISLYRNFKHINVEDIDLLKW
jgi:NADH-quinone oxidoreductase subunit K